VRKGCDSETKGKKERRKKSVEKRNGEEERMEVRREKINKGERRE
jgi:hypothetical protein